MPSNLVKIRDKMEKKAAEMALNTIIAAALVLVVLVVLIVIFGSQIGKSGKTFDSCAAKNGVCGSNDHCPSDYPIKIVVDECKATNTQSICCIKSP